MCLRTRLLLLTLVQGQQGNTGNLAHLETATWNITLRLTTLTETRNKHFIVFIDKIQTTITRNESRNLLTVLDQLNTDTLTDGRIRLFGFKTTKK